MTKVSIGTVWWEQQRTASIDLMYDESNRGIYYADRVVGTADDIDAAVALAEHMFSGPAWGYHPKEQK